MEQSKNLQARWLCLWCFFFLRGLCIGFVMFAEPYDIILSFFFAPRKKRTNEINRSHRRGNKLFGVVKALN